MIEAAFEALQLVLDPSRLLFIGLGVCIGLIVGILPGLGGIVGMSVVLPFIYGMDPVSGIGLLIGMASVIHTSDTFPSVLLGVPGSTGSQATIMDGYPLAKKGRAAEALSSAFSASLMGGLVGAVLLFSILTVARPIVLAMRSPELFMVALFGLSMVAILSRGSAVTGMISAALGLMLGAVGHAPAHPEFRYTFGEVYLFDGIPIAVLALALFALPEMLDLAAQGRSISEVAKLQGGRITGLVQTWRNRWLVLRSSAMGAGLGIIPGLSGPAVDWITYGVAAQSSGKDNQFGKGDIRGVIAPESANNAKEGGALVPTLLFGIPGSGTTAILLGGLILLGIQPGPSMVGENLPVTLSIIWTLAIANVLGALVCMGLSGWVAKISLIPGKKLMPFLLVILLVASYQSTRHWGDIIAFVVIGVIGWLMKHLGWPRAPLIVGFVLASGLERYLTISMGRYGTEWFTFPIVVVLAVIIVFTLGFSVVRSESSRLRRFSRLGAPSLSPDDPAESAEADPKDGRADDRGDSR